MERVGKLIGVKIKNVSDQTFLMQLGGKYAAAVALEPSGAPTSPADIANAIAFFAAPTTHFITGQTLFVDGGKSLG